MSVRSIVVGQFRRPHGLLGRMAGLIMATRSSNRARNAWTIGLLGIGTADRVLELGCGPGLALAGALARASRGHVLGIDHSPLMVAQARRRNSAAADAGRLELRCQDLTDLDGVAGTFDKVLTLNVLMFLAPAQRQALFARLRALMTPGGRIAITYQPRHRGATADDARKFAALVATEMQAAGFGAIRTEELNLSPVPAACVLGSALR